MIALLGLLPLLLSAGQEEWCFPEGFGRWVRDFNLRKISFGPVHPSPYPLQPRFLPEPKSPKTVQTEIRYPLPPVAPVVVDQRPQNPKKCGRAFFESLAFMSVSAVLYWWRWGLWAEDWQYSFTWEEQRIRFFTLEATKFDSNSFMTNFSHGPNGAIFYNFARTNHLGVFESCLYAIITSLFWEYVIEYKEIVSVNDNLFNSFLGFSMGEPLFQLGHYLSHQRDSASRILGIIFNPVLALNNWLSGKKGKLSYGDLRSYRHRGSLFFGPVNGWDAGSSGYRHFNIGFRSQLLSIPGYETPGKTGRKLNKPFLSELFADINLGSQQIEEFNIVTKATVLGYFSKNIRSTRSGKRGTQVFWGLGSAYDMHRKKSDAPYDTITSGSSQSEWIEVTRPTEFSDKWAIINTLGPLFELSAFMGSVSLRLRVEAYFDFALMNALALGAFSEQNILAGIKSTLSKYGYYYAYGFTALSKLSIRLHPFSLQGKIKYHHLDSIDGLDRFQDYIEDDFHLRDSRLLADLNLSWRIKETPISCQLGFRRIFRKGTIKEIRQQESEHRLYFRMMVHFN